MGFSVTSNMADLRRRFEAVATRQLPYAIARALNDTADDVRKAEVDTMKRVFDRPTPYTLNAFQIKPATKANPVAVIEQKQQAGRRDYLKREAAGGPRKATALESLLRHKLPYEGFLAAILPADNARLDRYGNWSTGQRNEVLSAIGAMRDSTSNRSAASLKRKKNPSKYFVPTSGLPPAVYERTGGGQLKVKGPDWEALRDRVENAEPGEVLPRGVVPSCGVLLAAGVDFQGDRTEVTVCAFGSNFRRWVVDHIVIPHYIGDDEGRAALDALLKATWRTELGLRLPLDMMAVDEGNFTEDVLSWAKKHPWTRVITVKGASTGSGPVLRPQQTKRENGGAVKTQKRRWIGNVSQLKGDFYTWLAKVDPAARGFVQFATGLGDEYYRQITAEVRVLKRATASAPVASTRSPM